MKVDITWYSSGASKIAKKENIAVVIDAIRASCFIVEALARGVKYIVPVSKIEEARILKDKILNSLLAGESKGERIEGFDLGPSPLKLHQANVKGKVIIYRTSSGTQVLHALKGCDEVYIASFLNIKAVGEYVFKRALNLGKDVTIALAGFLGREFALEDFLCAGGVISYFPDKVELTDQALAAKLIFRAYRNNIYSIVSKSKSATLVSKLGYGADVEYCCRVNVYNIIPKMRKIDDLYAVTL